MFVGAIKLAPGSARECSSAIGMCAEPPQGGVAGPVSLALFLLAPWARAWG